MTVRLAEMTSYAFAARVKAHDPIVIIPVGATEQHGPHLPLGTDVIIPVTVAERVAERIGAIVAPPVTYGYKSQPKTGGGNHIPGTISLDADVLVGLVRTLVTEFARHGVRKVVLLDGHMENQWFLTEAADLAVREARRDGIADLTVVKLGYWEFISPATEELLFEGEAFDWGLEHAAVMETSVMLHLRPDLVGVALIPDHPPARFPRYDTYPFDVRPIPEDGVLSSARRASAAKGEAFLAQVVPDLAAALATAFNREAQA